MSGLHRRFLCLTCGSIITGLTASVPWYRIKRRCGLCSFREDA